MNYQHRFRVRAPLAEVTAFHQRAASMAAITPPPILVQMHRAPVILAEGDEMAFSMWLGPLPIRWLARIEQVSPNGFSDRQLHGPFTSWVHRHTFQAVDEQVSEVIDEVNLQLSSHPFWRLVGWIMSLGLPLLFAYRAWKTKRMLE